VKELNKDFHGIMSHHIDTSSIDRSTLESIKIWGRVSDHNLAETLHFTTQVLKRSIGVKHKSRRQLSELREEATGATQAEISELTEINGKLKDSWKGVIDTNRALPRNLQGRHKK